MEVKVGLTNSAFRHVRFKKVPREIWDTKTMELTMAKGERFAFQIILSSSKEVFCSLDNYNSLSWKGLTRRIRLNCTESEISNLDTHFIGYVQDDNGLIVGDPILHQPGKLLEADIPQALWVEGKVPSNCQKDNLKVIIDIWIQKGFEDEEKIATFTVRLNIMDIAVMRLKENNFFLDLWQHPSNWARQYQVPLWSKEHWQIIEAYLEELASVGQKTITLIVSETPWAGQNCSKTENYPSNLFEHNMVEIRKSQKGKLICDFSILDRYVETCMRLGIDQQIELLGLLGVWERGFGYPLEDYTDAIRVRYYDEHTGKFKYINKKQMLQEYVSQIATHFTKNGWWEMTRVTSDEPNDPSLFRSWLNFLDLNMPRVKYKVAFFNEDFVKEFNNRVTDWIPLLPTLINCWKQIDILRKQARKHNGKICWYVCCQPPCPNTFISSPPLESRLIGWLTYNFGLDGFLRWAYAIWPHDPWNRPSYKFPHWNAGDMFFVYPGRSGKPVRSLRWENLRFGLQDYQLFLILENLGYSQEDIRKRFLEKVLGNLEEIITRDYTLHMNYSLDFGNYEKVRAEILREIVKIRK